MLYLMVVVASLVEPQFRVADQADRPAVLLSTRQEVELVKPMIPARSLIYDN
jgi:hypothetical protein